MKTRTFLTRAIGYVVVPLFVWHFVTYMVAVTTYSIYFDNPSDKPTFWNPHAEAVEIAIGFVFGLATLLFVFLLVSIFTADTSTRSSTASRSMLDIRNPIGLTNPLSINNPMGLTNPMSVNNPVGFTNPLSPNNPMGINNPSSPISPFNNRP